MSFSNGNKQEVLALPIPDPYAGLETCFAAPATEAELNLAGVIQDQLPDAHQLDIIDSPETNQTTGAQQSAEPVRSSRFSTHIGRVSFVDWSGDVPTARYSDLQIDVFRPGRIARAAAWVLRREANSSVNLTGIGGGELGGGEPISTPDLPLDLVTSA